MTTADGSVLGSTQIFGSAPRNRAFNVVLLAVTGRAAETPAALDRHRSFDLGEMTRVTFEIRFAHQRAVDAGRGNLEPVRPLDWIGDVDVPTAVVVTERDGLVPPERQRRLADSIPGSRVFPVDGDHSVCVSAPRLFIPALQSALTTVTTIPARPV